MFVFEGVSLWVTNEVSNTDKHLRNIDEKNQHNMRTTEETPSLFLVFCLTKKRINIFQRVFLVQNSHKINLGHLVIGNNAESK